MQFDSESLLLFKSFGVAEKAAKKVIGRAFGRWLQENDGQRRFRSLIEIFERPVASAFKVVKERRTNELIVADEQNTIDVLESSASVSLY